MKLAWGLGAAVLAVLAQESLGFAPTSILGGSCGQRAGKAALSSPRSSFALGTAHGPLNDLSLREGTRAGRSGLAGAPSMALKNDLMVRAARGEKVERTPVWLFRQAGRHLPEYEAYKKATGKNFVELLKDPKDVAECTMQPIRRYNLDAAILFSDILVIAEALNIEVTMPGGVGIQVPNPLTGPEDLEKRVPKSVDVNDKLKHVIDAVKLIKKELNDEVPLIGFSAAPWTLMYYMVGGSSKKNQQEGERWLKEHPEAAQRLLDTLTNTVIDYMSAQVDAGADMIQVFEAMGEFISQDSFYTHAMPCMEKIAVELRRRHPKVPLLVFPRGATYSLVSLQRAGYDVVTMDTKTDRIKSLNALNADALISPPSTISGGASGLQGNIDVAVLHRDTGSKQQCVDAVASLLKDVGTQKLIANLGEGLMGKESPELVACLIDEVHAQSEKIISAELVKN